MGQRPDHAIAVVRMEHMWDDIIQLDQLFGGTGNFGTFQEVKITHRSEKNAVFLSTDISDTNTIFLCCLIAREIEIYQQLILKAWNLDAIQKRKSLNNLLDRCLIEPSEKTFWSSRFPGKAFNWARHAVNHWGGSCHLMQH